MRFARFAVAGSLLTAGVAHAGPGQAPILGGERTAVGDYPSTFAIEVGGGLCTATLLTPEWVLTAAHCISPEVLGRSKAQIIEGLKIHVGTVSVWSDAGTVVRARDVIPHPDFSLDSLGAHDIGLIRLKAPLTTVTPVPINLIANQAPIGIGLTMVGFGVSNNSGPLGGSSGVQYVVEQTSVSCGGDADDANLLCFDQTSGRGKCFGDSGGPSFAVIDGRTFQVGVTSFGDENCAEFGADTRIDAERAFLAEHVPAIQCGEDDECTPGCGFGALPADPDCPPCAQDADCPGSRICFDHQCMAAPFEPTGLGSECTSGAQCETNQCGRKADEQLCILRCTPGEAGGCPDGFDCADATGGGGACWPAATGGGCCDAGHRGAPTAWLGVIVLGAALGRRRRRRA